MTPFLTELIFVGSIVGMLLLLAALQSIAKYNSSKKIKNSKINIHPPLPIGAKVIQLPKQRSKPAKERFLVEDSYSEEEIV